MDTPLCTCAACAKSVSWRKTPIKNGSNSAVGENLDYPWGWGREYCSKHPDDPNRNRVLCPECLVSEKVQRGTVRFVEKTR